jgi:hypothetical protein
VKAILSQIVALAFLPTIYKTSNETKKNLIFVKPRKKLFKFKISRFVSSEEDESCKVAELERKKTNK